LSDFPSADAEKTKKFIERLDKISSNYSDEGRAIYPNRTLSGKENKQAQEIQINDSKQFEYTSEKLELYCNHFGLDFLVKVLLENKDSVQLKEYVQSMDNEQLTALYAHPLAEEDKAGFYSALQCYLTPDQKDNLFHCMDKWIFCASLSARELQHLSNEQFQDLLQTPIQNSNALAAYSILFIKQAPSSVYLALFDCFFESPELFPGDFINKKLHNNHELTPWCKNKAKKINQDLYQILNQYNELTLQAYDQLRDAFQISYPQRNLLTRLSPTNLPFLKGNYEFYATILYGFYQKNQLDIRKTVDNIHLFVPHYEEETEKDICNAIVKNHFRVIA